MHHAINVIMEIIVTQQGIYQHNDDDDDNDYFFKATQDCMLKYYVDLKKASSLICIYTLIITNNISIILNMAAQHMGLNNTSFLL